MLKVCIMKTNMVGCVKRAHDIDANLSAHVMHENIMSKASSVLALLYGVRNAGTKRQTLSMSSTVQKKLVVI